MADGSTLNGVEARRLHRCNAQEVVDEAERMLTYYRDQVLIFAAMTPMPVYDGDDRPMDWATYIRTEIDGMWDEIQEQVLAGWKARYLLDYPDECVDDYDALEGGA
jgi:hypothetical protein